MKRNELKHLSNYR